MAFSIGGLRQHSQATLMNLHLEHQKALAAKQREVRELEEKLDFARWERNRLERDVADLSYVIAQKMQEQK